MALVDENWEADGDRVWCPADRTTVAFGPMEEEDAKLAAQAPAMARLLLKYGNSAECPECLRQAPYEPHAATCSLDAVLRAAGVL